MWLFSVLLAACLLVDSLLSSENINVSPSDEETYVRPCICYCVAQWVKNLWLHGCWFQSQGQLSDVTVRPLTPSCSRDRLILLPQKCILL